MPARWTLCARGAGLTLLLAASLAAGCGPRPMVEAPLGWSRLDLTKTAPGVKIDLYHPPAPFSQRLGYLGREEVRDLSRVPESQLKAFPFRRAPQIRVLEQAAGVRLAWRVELGREPYVSFIPLGWSGRPCECLFRFGLRDAHGGLHELFRDEATELGPRAPGAVEIDLSDFAESAVELLFEVDLTVPPDPRKGVPRPQPDAVPTLLWGSPAAYDRRPVEGWRPAPPATEPARPNVLILGADTLRADHVGPWRPAPATSPSLTPAIDRLAEESDVWLSAYSTFNSTNPSFASIFSGLYGKNHGVYDLHTPLPAARHTLAELFSEAGYETFAVISASHLGDHNSGLGQGFDRVLLADHTFAGELPVDEAMAWIAARRSRAGGGEPRPFFAWLHLFDPHTPNTPPGAYASGFRPFRPTGLHPVLAWTPFRRPGDRTFEEPVLGGERDLYAGEVAYLDRQVDRILGFLESRELLDDTVVVFVADHGENLGEHGIDYRHTGLWETTTHVPLLIRWPDASQRASPKRLEGLVQTLDLYPTLLAAAGIEAPELPEQDGTDLRQLTYDGRPGRRAVFAEHAGGTGVMVRTATHRYVRMAGEPSIPDGVYLYNLVQDPEETRNLAGRGLPVEKELSDLVDRWLRDRREGPEAESRSLSDEERKKLEALGYVN